MSMACPRACVSDFILWPVIVYSYSPCCSEKYVTRGEYEELKRRFDRLESIVSRISGGDVGPEVGHDASLSATFRSRGRSGSGSMTASSLEQPRGLKFEHSQPFPDPLLSPRTRPHAHGSASPYRNGRLETYDRPIRHRESHERSPSGGSTKGQ